MPERPLPAYRHDLPFGYCLGYFATLELLRHQPERVRRIVLHSRLPLPRRQALHARCHALGLTPTENDAIIERFAHKRNIYCLGLFDKVAAALEPQRSNRSARTAALEPQRSNLLLVRPNHFGNVGAPSLPTCSRPLSHCSRRRPSRRRGRLVATMRASAEALPRRIKLGYGVADLGASLSYGAINTWLLYFLINIVGLAPFSAGLVFVLGRLFDALLDPVMGIYSDRHKARWGRKAFIRRGAVPLGLVFAALWALATLPLPPAARFALALLLFMLFSFLYTVVQVPYMALTPELAPDYDERTSLSSYRVAFGTLASLLAVALPPAIVLAVAGGGDLASSPPGAWLALGIVFGLLTTLPYLVMLATVPEPRRSVEAATSGGLLREARSAFGVHGFPEVFALFVAITVGVMVVSSMLPFYLESALRLPAEQQPLVLGLLFGAAIAAFPLWTRVSDRFGKRAALALSLLLLAIFTAALVWFSPGRGLAFLLTMAALAGVSLSAVLLLPWAMLPDVVEFDDLANGSRREGLLYALFTFGQKSAGSLGVFANALAAALFGYQQGVVEQAPATVAAIETMVGPVAAGVFVLAALLTWRYPITRAAHARARAELAERDRPD